MREIGWSKTSNLLYSIQRTLKGENNHVPQEIGMSVEDKLWNDKLEEIPCGPCVPTTVETTTIGPT